MQCKDIPDLPILKFLADIPVHFVSGNKQYRFTAGWHNLLPRGVACRTVRDAMPPLPSDKLALAKMKQLLKRGLVDGCGCGCRGDFEITDKGLAFLARDK